MIDRSIVRHFEHVSRHGFEDDATAFEAGGKATRGGLDGGCAPTVAPRSRVIGFA